jgi:hypothetical protein
MLNWVTKLLAGALMSCLLLASAMWGQSTFATITGTVIDPAGAAIPNATITVVQAGTNYRYEVQSNNEGQYTVPYLRDGTFTLTVAADGFQEFRVEDIIVTGREIRRVDAQMRLGTVGTVVEVSGGSTLVETETARIANSKDREVMRALPLTLRRAWDYFTMTPQVERTGGWHIRFAGSGNNQGDATIDGTSVAGAGGNAIGPLLDRTELVQEMRIDIAQGSAEQQTMGQVTLISRAGTNEFHGTLADYYQTPAFRARNPFNSARSTARSQQLILSGGGPVYIPKIYDGRNRTFFFHTTEIAFGSLRNAAVNRTVPLDVWRTGDFSRESTAIRDPFNGNAPFAGNVIPASRISPVTNTVQERFLFRPNFGDPNVFVNNNYRTIHLLPFVHQPTITNRVDHRISDKQFIYGRWTAVRWNFDGPVLNLPNIEGKGVSQRNMDTLTMAHTYVFTPAFSNEFRYGLASQRQPSESPIRGLEVARDLGLQGLAPDIPDVGGMPQFNFQNLAVSGISAANTCSPCNQDLVHNFIDNLIWFKNKHTFKFGVNLRYSTFTTYGQPGALFGNAIFSNRFTGHTYADFLLGVPSTLQRAFPAIRQDRSRWSQGYYFTDEWKIRQNLTLTFGLRWDQHSPWIEANDMQSMFDIGTGSIVVPDNALARVSPLMPTGYVNVVGASTAGFSGRTLIATDRDNFQPRFGFAWRPFSANTTVVRGGWGLAHNVAPRGTTAVGVPFVISEPDYTNPTANPLLLPNIFPSTGSGGPSTVSLPGAIQQDIRVAKYMQYSFTIEHQRWDTDFMASYNGTATRQGVWTHNINQPFVDDRLFVDKARRFPNYPDIGYAGNGAGHQYHALTLQAHRRPKNGLYFQAFWTWARDIGDLEDGQGPEDAHNRLRDRTWWERLPTHRWSGNMMWDLPFGKGKPFMRTSNAIVNGILGGWQLNTIVAFETGRALTPTWTGPDPTGTRFTQNPTRPVVTLRPDILRDPNISNPGVDRWFDVGAFAAPQLGSFGTSGRGVIVGAPTAVMHNSVAKHFLIKERAKLRLEFLATNTLNHPNYLDPNTNVTNVGVAGRITDVTNRNDKFDTAIPREIQAQIRLEW